MNSAEQYEHEQRLQAAVKSLFSGVAPERAHELEQFWKDYGTQFRILDDDGPEGALVMDAGAYIYIRFNHRIMRLFWLSGFLLWEGYRVAHGYSVSGNVDTTWFAELLACFEETRTAKDVDAVAWPKGVPLPGVLVDYEEGDPARVAGELAIFSVGWALLHELRHLIHQHDGTSAPQGDVQLSHEEELSCDEFATKFMLEHAEDYARDHGDNRAILHAKRQAGVYCALLALTLLARNNWGSSDTHPAIQARIDNTLDVVEQLGLSKVAAVISASSFSTLKLICAEAPHPIERVAKIAERERWNPLEDVF